ncbi:MAG TPA: cytochrome c-type biogenesis protein [Acidimicrobiales bacterium]|nr:cytochrome c-type biogenesis protein [Acidimicrobiales bacterium]
MRKWLPWLTMAVLVVSALAVGSSGDGGGRTTESRVTAIAKEVRCPTCEGLSVEESDAATARVVRDEIRRRVEAGESDGDIRAYLVSRFGKDILLKPEASGVSGLVWALPVVAAVCALGGLAFAFRRWRADGDAGVSDEDRALVEQARQAR